MFAKDDFDILLEHYYWDYAIELLPGSKSKSMKVYSLLYQAKEAGCLSRRKSVYQTDIPIQVIYSYSSVLHQKKE